MLYRRLKTDSFLGALTAFASDVNGIFYGITAAHSLEGRDDRILKNIDKVQIWAFYQGREKFVECGIVKESVTLIGRRRKWDYGLVDVGVFTLHAWFKDHIYHNLTPIILSPLIKKGSSYNMRGRRVYGYSHMKNFKVRGSVRAIERDGFDLLIDLDIGHFTNEGDSGMLIKDSKGAAMAMHLWGKEYQQKKIIGAVFLNRALYYLERKLNKKLELYSYNHSNSPRVIM